jgi:hypothetical protein
VATAIVHLTLVKSMQDIAFILNFLGYLALTAAYFLPQFRAYHGTVRWVFMGFTAITIIAWAAIGLRTPLAYADKVMEVILIALLWMDGRQS